MQNIYPLFERNRILKKELLWSLRDYSFAHVQLEYQEHGQGIVKGCEIAVKGSELVVKPGMIKYGEFIGLMMEEETVSFEPDEGKQYLKIKVEADRTSQDYIAYRMELFLDHKEERQEHEFELCRFHLRKGAQLRDRYTGFTDMVTEYDTINLIHASWAGFGGESMAPAVTRYFGERLLEGKNSQPEDRFFAYQCLSQAGAVPPKILDSYIKQRIGNQAGQEMGKLELYRGMCLIVDDVGKGGEIGKKLTKGRHTIVVD